MRVERGDQFLSRSASLAGRHVAGRSLLSAYKGISAQRDVWNDIPNPSGSRIDSGQHCRGARSGEYKAVHSTSANRAGIFEGARNSSLACGTSESHIAGENRSGIWQLPVPRPDASNPYSPTREKGIIADVTARFSPIRHSLFAIRHFFTFTPGEPNHA